MRVHADDVRPEGRTEPPSPPSSASWRARATLLMTALLGAITGLVIALNVGG